MKITTVPVDSFVSKPVGTAVPMEALAETIIVVAHASIVTNSIFGCPLKGRKIGGGSSRVTKPTRGRAIPMKCGIICSVE